MSWRTRLGFEPDEKQARVLASGQARDFELYAQWGKSTVAAIKAVHRAYRREGSLVVAASPTERQSAEFLRKASEMVARLEIRPRAMGRMRSACCCRTDPGLWDCRGRRARYAGFRLFRFS